MKKLLFSLAAVMFCGFFAQAQVSGIISGTVVDAQQQPVPGVAVFFLKSHVDWNGSIENPYLGYDTKYTDANGNYTIAYFNYDVSPGDSAVIGVMDCQGDLHTRKGVAGGNIPNQNLQIPCVPGPCDAYLSVDSVGDPNIYSFMATSLRDSAYAQVGNTITHQWSFTGVGNIQNFIYDGPNLDTVWYLKSALPADFEYCYQRTASCNSICDTVGTITPPAPFCEADFYVDSVNSINFQGQVVLWENSTTDSGSIVDYHWTFGDGNFSNSQYPTHTYSDTGIYEVCLKITAINAGDTCVSTHCDSIGFDSNGNLIYKSMQQGFTINVVDPATVGQNEVELASHFNLFPNPSSQGARLDWDESMSVQQIDVINISGKLIQSIEPDVSFVKFDSMQSGVYLLRIQSDQGVATVKMMVQ